MKEALTPRLADMADLAQRKVQEAHTPADPTEGIAAAKEAAAEEDAEDEPAAKKVTVLYHRLSGFMSF